MFSCCRILLFPLAFFLAGGHGFSQEPSRAATRVLADDPTFIAASQALAEQLFEVAAVKAGRLAGQQGWTSADKGRVIELWVESLVRAGKGPEAVRVVQSEDVPNEAFWLGQALLLTREYVRAETAFAAYHGPLEELAEVGEAHALLGQGRVAAARSHMRLLRDSGAEDVARHARLFFNEMEIGIKTPVVLDRLAREKGGKSALVQAIRASALIDDGHAAKAEAVLRDLLQVPTPDMSRAVRDASTVLLAEALWRQKSPAARTVLLELINGFQTVATTPSFSTEYWSDAFNLLDRMAMTDGPDEALLVAAAGWAVEASLPERQGHALWFLAQELHRLQRDLEATGLLEALLQLYPHHPRASDALRLAMQLHGAAKADARVLELAGRWQRDFGGGGESVVDFLTGLIRFMRGEHVEALASFMKAADVEANEPQRRRSLYNAAVCAIQAGQTATLATLTAQLAQVSVAEPGGKSPLGDSAADLALDKALSLAAQGDPGAEPELKAFLADHPQHHRSAEAAVALAEVCLLDVPPRIKTALEALDSATAQAADDSPVRERISYVRLWTHEAQQDLAGIAREGQLYLTHWPDGPRADEVQMKVAEAFFRLENYARARTEFEMLVNQRPNSPFAEAALYFAGVCAISLPSTEGISAALGIWDDLAQRGGPLAFAARRQQAVVTGRFGDETTALKLFTALLEDPAAAGEQRLSLQAEMAELLLRMGKKTPAHSEEAVVLLRSLLADKSLPYLWAGRCSVLLATALRDLGRPAEAQEACYDVINIGSNPVTAPASPTEYQWYYRAGFLAVELLEQGQQWEAAARMAEKLSRSGGDRAQEAAERASKIRMKHYLWDDQK